jgi:hypothetical protein
MLLGPESKIVSSKLLIILLFLFWGENFSPRHPTPAHGKLSSKICRKQGRLNRPSLLRYAGMEIGGWLFCQARPLRLLLVFQ